MNETTIDSLAIEINSNAGKAVGGIEALAESLNKLKSATRGGMGITATNNQLAKLAATTKELGAVDVRMERVVRGLNSLSKIGNPAGLRSTITQLKKLPQITKDLDDKTIEEFTAKIERLTVALEPLSKRLDKVGRGFAMMPRNMNKTLRGAERVSTSAKKNSFFFTELWHKYRFVQAAMSGVTHVIKESIKQSNAYIEDMNLFSVAMGGYADEAQKYAWKVGELLGIDPREWMRNQGVFMTITEGFGVASDRAYTMSKNLTQLGYDLSSFYNISFEDAMTKLTSGISGELEPLRRLGYDLSVARLQQEAYTLGINKSVNAMTQAEKAQLRYYAIMTQVTTSHGDMARTIEAPANQLRILKAQVIQLARAFGNILVPVLNIVLPYLVAFTKVVREALEALAKFLHVKLPKFDLSDVVRGKKEMQGIGAGADDIANGLGKAAKKAKELKNATLGIDELNVISPPEDNAGAGGRGAGIGGAMDSGLDFPLPEYDFLKGLESKGDEIVNKVKNIIGVLEAIVTGALFTLGVVMCILGHPVYGVAMMIAGFTGMAVMTLNGSKLPDTVKKALAQVMSIVGGMALALGAFLIAVGSFPVGVGLVVAGASMLVGAATLNFGLAKGKVKQFLITIMQTVSGALLALGVCLLWLGGTLPLALSMIAAGAVGLVASTSLNFNAVTDKIKSFLKEASGAIGTALLTIGVVITMSGAGLPVGIALMIAGAAGIVTQVSLNWSAIKTKITAILNKIGYVVAGALLAIGFIMLASGVAFPLGIAMIVAGAGTLVATMSLDWGKIKNCIQENIKSILVVLSGALIVLGVILALSGVGLPMGITLIAAGVSTLVTITASSLNWNAMKDQMKKKLDEMKATLNAWKEDLRRAPIKIYTAFSNYYKSITSWFRDKYGNPSISIAIDFVKGKLKGGWGKIKNKLMSFIGLAETGGIITPRGIQQFANGGFGKHGKMNTWNGIPAYASGGSPHGSMFMAGENGAELVGHVGGQTEVLNRSQIATVILNSTVQGMAQFLPAWNGIYAQVAAIREDRLSDSMMYSGASYKTEDEGYTLRQFAEEFMPLMRSAENNVKKQADKDESVTVRIGAREINSEITRQNKANGFVFAE